MNLDVSRETIERLNIYAALIGRWNPRINLVARSTIADFRRRHVEDCLQLAALVRPERGIWADLGSGGGLPGIVMAIAFADSAIKFRLIESDQRKAAFLSAVLRETGLQNTKVIADRIETVNPLNAAYLSARALAPLPRLMPYITKHLAKDGQAWLMKGEQWQAEIDEAREAWSFDVESYPSQTQPGAAILKINGVSND